MKNCQIRKEDKSQIDFSQSIVEIIEKIQWMELNWIHHEMQSVVQHGLFISEVGWAFNPLDLLLWGQAFLNHYLCLGTEG